MSLKGIIGIVFVMLWVGACSSINHLIATECGKVIPFEEKSSIQLKNHKMIELKTVSTDVEFKAWDQNSIAVTLTGTRPEMIKGDEILFEDSSSEVEISFAYDKKDNDVRHCYQKLKATIYYPKAISKVELKSVSGNLSIDSFLGDKLELESVSGDLSFSTSEKSSLNLDAETISGDISGRILQYNSAQIKLETVSGDTTIHLPKGFEKNMSIELQSVSGKYKLKGITGKGEFRLGSEKKNKLKLESVSGDLIIIESKQ